MKELLEKYGIESIEDEFKELFNNGGNDFNATDIEVIKFLLKENQELKKQIENYQKINNFKTYKLFIRQYNILANDYVTYERTIKTKDLYHEIGKIYCTEICEIKRIDYYEIEGD